MANGHRRHLDPEVASCHRRDLDESATGNGLVMHVYMESGPPVSVKRLSNRIPTYLSTSIFDSTGGMSGMSDEDGDGIRRGG